MNDNQPVSLSEAGKCFEGKGFLNGDRQMNGLQINKWKKWRKHGLENLNCCRETQEFLDLN